MSDFHGRFKQQLVGAAGAMFAASPVESRCPSRTRRRVGVFAAVALGVALLAAAALAASGILGVGAPVRTLHSSEHSTRDTGVGVALAGRSSVHFGSQDLLAIAVADPGGGLPWGMRLVRTTRGVICVQVGRLLDGRLGVLGQDGVWHDDGLFHELPVGLLDPDTCSQPSYYALYHSEGMPAAGEIPGPVRSCLYPGIGRARPGEPAPCPSADERTLAFGLLGPHAVSVSYRLGAVARTIPTVGSHGAYLIVLRGPIATAASLPREPLAEAQVPGWSRLDRFDGLGSSSSPLGDFPVRTESSLLSSVTFRFGAHMCQSGAGPQHAGLPQCARSIARSPTFVPQIQRGLRTTVTVVARRIAHGYRLTVSFRAPAAVYDASTAYAVEYWMPRNTACGRTGSAGQPFEGDVARGQTVRVTIVDEPPKGCAGTLSGRVVYGRQPDAFSGPTEAETVGRFSFPARQRW